MKATSVCRRYGKQEVLKDFALTLARGDFAALMGPSGSGKSTRGNCVPCCTDCNAKKKAYTPAEQILSQLFPDGG